MSISSTSSSNGVSGLAAARTNGYRLTTTRSIGWMPCLSMATRSSGRDLRARIPPWIAGCRVLTLPSSISGNPVTSDTLVTRSPSRASAPAVPPVETSSIPRPARSLANSTSPVLSDTLSSARVMVPPRAASTGRRLDTRPEPPLSCQVAPELYGPWRRAATVRLFLCPHRGHAPPGVGKSSGARRRTTARQGKNAHHRQGQVVQQREGLRVH